MYPTLDPDTTLNLPEPIAREVFAELCRNLPSPAPDTPENRETRYALAMAAVAALHPYDAFEGKLAATIVVAETYANDSFRLSSECRADILLSLRCRDQANATLRNLRALLRDYHRMQAERDKAIAEMHPAAMERAGYWWKEIVLPGTPPARPAEQPGVAVEPAPDCDRGPAPDPDPGPGPAPDRAPASTPDNDRWFASLSEAEQYATIYPERARMIRARGGLPQPLTFGPPEPDIVQALVHGTTPVLRALGPPFAMATQ